MKRFLRNTYVKLFAVILSVVCVWMCVYEGMGILSGIYGAGYLFEENFSDSRVSGNLERSIINYSGAVLDGLGEKYSAFLSKDELEKTLDEEIRSFEPEKSEIEYYIEITVDGEKTVLANTSFRSKDYFDENLGACIEYSGVPNSNIRPVDRLINKIIQSHADADAAQLDETNLSGVEAVATDGEETEFVPAEVSVKAYFGYNTNFCAKVRNDWNAAKTDITSKVNTLLFFAALTFILIVYILWMCGKDADGNFCTLFYDRMFAEFNLLILAAVLTASLFAFVSVIDSFDLSSQSINSSIFVRVLCFGVSFAYLVVLNCVLSFVRNAKCGMLLKRSAVFRIAKFVLTAAVKFIKLISGAVRRLYARFRKNLHILRRSLSEKLSVYILLLFSLYSLILFVITVFFMGFGGSVQMAILGIIVYLCACFAIAKALFGFDVLKRGIFAMKDGEIGKQIVGCPKGVVGDVADAINTISDGLTLAVENETKAERMKAELITNVSHDLKTPLTSIINYSNLLCEMKLTPTEANDYAKIIKRKSERLKNMTADLFDISKAQSGNEKADLKEIDLAVLARQSAAEHESAAEKQRLGIQLSVPDGNYTIIADGNKLSRVFDNLLVNAVKYSLAGTRIYIVLSENGSSVRAEIKNISSYPLDFDPNEITDRFVRGEKSRTTDGNGLGLAIAKSYTELCGGKFSIVTDGDLFKAVLEFNEVKKEAPEPEADSGAE